MRLLIVALVLLNAAGLSHAQTGKAPWEEFDQRIKASEKVAPLGNNAFGDAVSLSNGALSFSATDVSLPGNSALPVSIGRNYAVQDRRYRVTDAMFADWDIELPHVSGVFAPDWLISGGGTNRCSSTSGPPAPGGILLTAFWQGTKLSIPGKAGGELLITAPGTTKPSTGGPWLWIAGDQVHLSCLSTIKNGTGEGFLAIDREGTKYWFDSMAQYHVPTLRENVTPSPGNLPIARRKNVLYASRVEDRFGNWVTYTYSNSWNQPGRLTAINSSESRQLTLTYNGNGHVASVSDGTRTWTYAYANAASGRRTLTSVTLPDASQWTINFAAFTNAEIQYTEVFAPGEAYRTCSTLEIPLNYASEPTGTITHPAGVVGTFTVNIKEHGRSKVTLNCGPIQSPVNNRNDDVNLFPISYHGFTLKTKQVSGPGITTAAWNYAYVSGKSVHLYPGTTLFGSPICKPWTASMGVPFYDCWAPPCTSAACAGSSTTTVTGPNNEWTRYTYGNTFRYDEGKLKKVESGTGPTNILRTATNTYDLSMVDQAYPAKYGTSRQVNYDGFQEELHRPQLTASIVQQGTTFSWQASAFDYYARPTQEVRSSTLGHSRTDLTAFHDNTAKWVIGQVATTYNTNEAVYTSQTEYDATTALPIRFYVPGPTLLDGILAQTLTYNADGTIATAKDGRNHTTTVGSWYRGVPQTIGFADATSRSATVSPAGFVTSVTDENGFTTSYGYDPLGRMTSLSHPTGDSVAWTATSIAYAQVASAEYGIPAGHWRQTVTRGDYRKEIYFDALWRPVIEREYDNAAVAATQRFSAWKYDHEGRVSFAGLPRDSATGIASFTEGATTVYDALGRPVSVSQPTEYGLAAVTNYAYLGGFKTQVTNPRGFATETSFQAFDKPDTSAPTLILAALGQAEQQTTQITRNALGNTLSLARSGSYGGGSVSATRHYVYDPHERLCKRVEPETGAALVDYDAAQNLAWSAEGSGLTALTCDRASVPAGDRTVRTYDARNRLTLVDYPGSAADIVSAYYPDGALQAITTGPSAWSYEYNKRRLPTREYLTTSAGTYEFRWTYTALGHQGSRQSFNGNGNPILPFSPNALGQPTQAGTFATQATYHPNGALKRYVYGNGIERNVTLNTRQLPDRVRDTLAGASRYDDSYDYDENGNPLAITDALALLGGTRDMGYDALDRLVYAHLHGHSIASWDYDPLDNIKSNAHFNGLSTATKTYNYDAANRLSSVATTGFPTANYGYDARGNITNRAGLALTFDTANRLTQAVGVSNYEYDGHGRRTAQWRSDGTVRVSLYTLDGRLQGEADNRAVGSTDYIYLGSTLVAKSFQHWSGISPVVSYLHADALGSPVLVTDAAGSVVSRERHQSYGAPVDGSVADTIGFTGHQEDPATGLVYMQQRYYDPAVGQFLSVDPVTALSDPVSQFNRYRYANSNPYRFTDPDGRQSHAQCAGSPANAVVCREIAAELGGAGSRGGSSVAPGSLAGLLTALGITTAQNESAEEGGSSSEPKQVEGWKPGSTGEPGSTEVAGKQSRRYGEDGHPDVDVDTGHNHKGADGTKSGDPHAHDWGRPADGSAPTDRDRGPPRPIREDDPPIPRGRPEVD